MFTTRPDTSFGMTYAVVAPEHPLVDVVTTDDQRPAVEEPCGRRRRPLTERTDLRRRGPDAGQAGGFTGGHVVNPFTGDAIPVFVADYVLMRYGTGAIMAVPAEDERDWDFADAHGLPVVRTTEPPEGFEGGAWTGDGVKINSGFLDGLDMGAAKERATDWLEERGIGARTVNYRLRDWLVSRQRYWGCPIPVVFCPDHGIVGVPDDELPVLAPDDVEFLPTGESPLARPTPPSATPRAPCAGARAARPTPWTRSWTRRGTSCASATRGPTTAPSTPPRPGTSCRSTSTSAGSSTPSSTSCTPASTPRPSSTSALRRGWARAL